MPLTTRNNRGSAIGIAKPFVRIFPAPDGTIGQADRQTTAYSYAGILATAAAAFQAFWARPSTFIGSGKVNP